MDLADTTPGPATDRQRRWQRCMVYQIKNTVYKERAMGIQIDKLCRYHMAHYRWRFPEYAVRIFAELAGVDWLFDPNTGEVRFFEFN